MPSQLNQLVERLENYYAFECEGGSLRSCVEWQQLRVALVRLAQVEQERDTDRARHADELAELRATHRAVVSRKDQDLDAALARAEALEQAHARLRALALEAGMAPEPNTPEMLDGYIRSVFYALRRTQKELAALQASRTEP